MNNKKSIVDILGKKRLYFDGGTGTALQKAGLPAGAPPERWSLEYPDRIEALHREYFAAGADIVKTNTFGVNADKYENYEEYITAAVAAALRAREGFENKFVALDIGPTGRMLSPLGDLAFEDAVELFAKNIRAAAGLGVDLVLIETMNDSYETKAAVLAAKESCDLPIFVTNVYDGGGKLMTGATPEAMVAMLEGLGVSALGANCSLGPDKLIPTVKRLCDAASVPVIVNPNAGLPRLADGESVFDISKTQFAEYMREIAYLGVSVLGGCCGTTPEYIRETVAVSRDMTYAPPVCKNKTVISSYTHALAVGDKPLLIGERINPTGKPKLKEALRKGDTSYILSEAIGQEEAGAHALDVNVGLPEIDEAAMMENAVKEIQAVTDLPLQIDTGCAEALERAMRIYNGKPLVNSVNGKEESMRAVFPLVKKYGGVVIALTMDENGIPDDATGRIKIAEKIIAEAKKHGIDKRDLVFDPLAMAVSSDKEAARVTLKTIKLLKEMGCHTSLGVSNVSFGLPEREKINAAYFTMALSAGLDLAIMNPHSRAMLDAYYSYIALSGKDDAFVNYIAYAEANKGTDTHVQSVKAAERGASAKTLRRAIVSGLKAEAAALAKAACEGADPLFVVNEEIIPALSEIGADFEAGKAYLPALLMSAEAANAAFDEVRARLPKGERKSEKGVILATVKGDIHDIGKNIVKTLLESHGFAVTDLGRDVPTEKILDAVKNTGIRLVGLSALMTTTVPAMEEATRALHEAFPDCRVMVGGAVLTPEYAEMMGADFYAKDAIGAVKIATELLGNNCQ